MIGAQEKSKHAVQWGGSNKNIENETIHKFIEMGGVMKTNSIINWNLALMFVTVSFFTSYSGEYGLIIANPDDTCQIPSGYKEGNKNLVLISPNKIEEFYLKYFSGDSSCIDSVKNISRFFGSGHWFFCSISTRRVYQQNLIKIIKIANIKNEDDLYDIFEITATKSMLNILKSEVNKSKDENVRKRLEHVILLVDKALSK